MNIAANRQPSAAKRTGWTSLALKLMALSTPLLLGACSLSMPEPWVKPYERNYLADPIMNFDRDPVAASYTHHVYQAREGSRGAEGGGGGGCGCN